MTNDTKLGKQSDKPKPSGIADGFKYLFRCTKELIDKYPLHSSPEILHLTQLQYHGYKETEENILHVMEELQYEMKVYPEHSDLLLDKYNGMKKLLNQYKSKP